MRVRNRVEEVLGWPEAVESLRKTGNRGIEAIFPAVISIWSLLHHNGEEVCPNAAKSLKMCDWSKGTRKG